MIINSTYFINEIFIAGQANSVDVDSSRSKLLGFISKYEPKFLTELLGQDLYSDLTAGLLEGPIPQKWTDLKNALANDATKESPIANYVYYWYLRNASSTTVEVGESMQLTENANRVSSIDKQVRAWNEMVDLNKKVIIFLNQNTSDYPNWGARTPIHFGWAYGNFLLCRGYDLIQYINSINL